MIEKTESKKQMSKLDEILDNIKNSSNSSVSSINFNDCKPNYLKVVN
jgi:hypothetical protein